MSYAIGIDIGVTNIKSVRVTRDGRVLSRQQIATMADSPDWPTRVEAHIAELERSHGRADSLGLAAPGLAAPDGSCIAWMQGRLGEVEHLNWSRRLGRPVPVLNDAQAALLGEVWKGAAAGARNAILLTLGTGVGGAAIVDGRILKGHIGRAGHFGHISLDIDGERDITGTPGSLEQMIGNCTIQKRSGGRFRTTHDLVAAYRKGDAEASAVWLRSVKALGCAVVSLVNALDPQVVIIGGGIAVAGDALFVPLRKVLDEYEWRPHGHKVDIVAAQLGEFAGALGAAKNGIEAARVTKP